MSDDGNKAARQHYETAVALHRQGRLTEAERHYQATAGLFPDHPGVLHGLGLICARTGRPEEAVALLHRAHMAAPADAGIASDLGAAHLRLGRFDEAVRCFRQALVVRPGHPGALIGLGDAFSILGRQDEAQRAFDALLAAEPDHAAAHFGLGTIASQRGRTTDARRAFERAVALAPGNAAYHRALADVAPFVAGDARLAALKRLAQEQSSLPDHQKVELQFALYKAHDDLNRSGAAFGHLQRGNALRRRLTSYDEDSVRRSFDALRTAFTPASMRAGAGYPATLPVYVVGMPRSGTTLVEQVLASHPDVFGAGELTILQDMIAQGAAGDGYPETIAALPDEALHRFGRACVERLQAMAPRARRVVDKLPANFRHIGLIHLALPQARIIHVRRDPMDTCFSCYSKLFLNGLNYTYDLGELGRYYKLYEALMDHWRTVLPPDAMLEVQYETLVEDFEREARRIVAFCGLAWDARCLDFHRTERAVLTLSQTQVRQPLFKNAVGRWRRYEPWLQPLRESLR